jgi:hypothetical protein
VQALAGPEEDWEFYTCSGIDAKLTKQVAAIKDGLYSRAAVALYTLVDDIDPTSGYGVSVMYQCRGDLALSDCPLCVQTAFDILSTNCNRSSYAHVKRLLILISPPPLTISTSIHPSSFIIHGALSNNNISVD